MANNVLLSPTFLLHKETNGNSCNVLIKLGRTIPLGIPQTGRGIRREAYFWLERASVVFARLPMLRVAGATASVVFACLHMLRLAGAALDGGITTGATGFLDFVVRSGNVFHHIVYQSLLGTNRRATVHKRCTVGVIPGQIRWFCAAGVIPGWTGW